MAQPPSVLRRRQGLIQDATPHFTGRYAVAFAVTAKHYGVLARDLHPKLECFSATTSRQLIHTPFEVILTGQILETAEWARMGLFVAVVKLQHRGISNRETRLCFVIPGLSPIRTFARGPLKSLANRFPFRRSERCQIHSSSPTNRRFL
jgi:hypothetical protein